MIDFYIYLCVESEQDWNAHFDKDRQRFAHRYATCYKKPEKFPAFFQYCDDVNSRYLGSWREVDKKAMLEYMDKCIQENQKLREQVEEMT